MLTRELCSTLQATIEDLDAEIARLQSARTAIDELLEQYGASLAAGNGHAERREAPTAQGGRRDVEKKKPSKIAGKELPREFSYEKWARKAAKAYDLAGVRTVVEPHEGGWRVRAA